MTAECLLERVLSTDHRVDRAAGVIRGVKIIGTTSRNNRVYPPAVLQRAKPFYEGRGCFLDHATGTRTVSARIGWLQNVRSDGAALMGDLCILKSHPNAPAIFEAAERNPSLFGLSHSADGRVVRRNGKAVVEEIVGVHSVDLVCDPATNNSLFESVKVPDADLKAKIGAILTDPALPDPDKLERIGELVGSGVVLGGGAKVSESEQHWRLPSRLQSAEEKQSRQLEREKLCRRLIGTRAYYKRQQSKGTVKR